jgi:hypothetical protein
MVCRYFLLISIAIQYIVSYPAIISLERAADDFMAATEFKLNSKSYKMRTSGNEDNEAPEGNFGKVRFGYDSATGQEVAIKMLTRKEFYRNDAVSATKAGLYIKIISRLTSIN